MMTLEYLKKKGQLLLEEKTQLQANVYALEGAIQFNNQLIKELEDKEATDMKVSESEASA